MQVPCVNVHAVPSVAHSTSCIVVHSVLRLLMPRTLTASLRRGGVSVALLPSTSVGRLVLDRLRALGDVAGLRGPARGAGASNGSLHRLLLEGGAKSLVAGGAGGAEEARWQVALAAAEWALYKDVDTAAAAAAGGAEGSGAAVVEVRGGGVELRLPVDEGRLLQVLALALAEACPA